MKTASPSTPTTASRTPSTKPSSCGAAAISTPPTTTPASSGRWWRDAIAWYRGSWSRSCFAYAPLPPAPVPEYVNYQSKVRKWCTIQVAGHSYSVPSRLIGKEVQIRLYADWVEVYYQGHLVERMERCVRGEGEANVNYRHVIGVAGAQAWRLCPLPLPGGSCFPPCTSG